MKKPLKKKNNTVKNKEYKSSLKKRKKTSRVHDNVLAYYGKENTSVDDSWDFKKANTKEFTHCFHSYPAIMIPQVARKIIELFSDKNTKLLFDPYCGTGTSLVEANLNGINAIGVDLNPLARLIAKSKTTKIDIQVLDLFLHDFIDFFYSINFQLDRVKSIIIPNVKNIDFWFAKDVQNKLGAVLAYIEKINNIDIKRFFMVAFSETIRESSFVKQGEFKLVKNKEIKFKEIDVFGIMISKLSRNKLGLIDFNNSVKNNLTTLIYDFNTVNEIPSKNIQPESIDIVVTSPPYGDSKTTVAYGQYSRMSNEWLGFSKSNQIDNILMGGKKSKNNPVFSSEILNDVIQTIKHKDKNRVKDVISFYEDYGSSINHVSSSIKKGGYACYVVGNRTVKGIKIPNDQITKDLFILNNFSHIETFIRNIPNKRMPSRNSPSNVIGETASTMKNEYIVVCRKN